MKRKWILAAIAVGVFLPALGAAAQGPQGTGAAEAAQSTNGPKSLNPIKWVKKEPHAETGSLDATSSQNAKMTAKMQQQGLLSATANLTETCSSIKELGDCVAGLHASRNLGLDFDCLKSKLSGVQTSLVGASSCASATDGKPVSLSKAIHALKPGADAKAEAKKAEKQSQEDFREAGSGT
jgi:hypothetical protein